MSATEYPKPLRWTIMSGGKYTLAVNGDYLSAGSPYRNYLTGARGAYNYPSQYIKVQCTAASFSSSTVDIMSASSQVWTNWNIGDSTWAVTYWTDTAGRTTQNEFFPLESTYLNGSIKYSAIYVNPDNNLVTSASHCSKVLVHEMGHSLGMNHAMVDDDSVMHQGKNIAAKLFPYDISELRRMYGT